jgi:hypothetical protein
VPERAREEREFCELPQIKLLARATPEQIDAWVDENLQSVADIRAMLKLLLRWVRSKWRSS